MKPRFTERAGFSLIEVMVATAILLIVVAGALSALTQSFHANEAISLMADLEENLRAGMNYMVKDLMVTAEGLPTGGIPIPSNGGASNINRPSPPGFVYKFPAAYTTLPSIVPGPAMGPGAVPNQVMRATDMLTVLYADNTIPLNLGPINSAANPVCNGTITAAGDRATFDPACVNFVAQNIRIQPGDLIMFSNAAGNVLQTVTGVAGQVLNFNAGDAFGLNGTNAPQGTISQIQTPPGSGTYPPTTATRVWMISYYLDNVTDPQRPQLMRQINFNPAQPVGEVIEDLQISYDIVDGVNNPANLKQPIPPDGPTQIRKVNLYLAGRSDGIFSQSGNPIRQNLITQVTLRSMAYVAKYN